MSQLFNLLSYDISRTYKLYEEMSLQASSTHVIGLIEKGKHKQAKQYLINIYPNKISLKWIKLFLRSLNIERILQKIFKF